MVDFKVTKPKKIYQKYKSGDSIRPRGRPKLEHPVRHHIVIRDSLWNWISEVRKPDETYGDALERVLKDKSMAYQDLRKKYDALLDSIKKDELLFQVSNNVMNKQVNQSLQIR